VRRGALKNQWFGVISSRKFFRQYLINAYVKRHRQTAQLKSALFFIKFKI